MTDVGGRAALIDQMRAAYAAGLCILPVANDGSKKPLLRTWKQYQAKRPTTAQMRGWGMPHRSGYGMVAGAVSRYREAWDFDDLETYHTLLTEAEHCGLGDVVRRISTGYCDETPAGGRRWIVQYPDTLDWRDVTLAKRHGRESEPDVKVLIELPTFAILAPSHGSTHPSGRPYVRLSGDFTTIACITADEHGELVALARTFDAMPPPAERHPPRPESSGDRPGDDFNRRTTWPTILEPAGWVHVYDRGDVAHWRRPGKAIGSSSATTNIGGTDLLYVFTSSTSFESNRSYSKFTAFATLHHGGDFAAAARALAAQGYGRSTALTVGAAPIGGPPPNNTERAPALTLTPLAVLLGEPDEAIAYVVEQRIASGSLNMLAGKPKAGKSTLARAIALEVSRGGCVMGSRCQQGTVWYLALEDKRAEGRRHFRQMGANGREPIRFLFDQPGHHVIAQMHALAATEAPMLIIVDTVQRLIKARDLNDYAEVTTKLTPLLALSRETGAAVLLIHHAGKAERLGIDSVLGSTALTGSVDNVFLLSRTERYRVLSSVQRIGLDLPETVLTLDEFGRVEASQTRQDADVAQVSTTLLNALSTASGELSRVEWLDTVEGRRQVKLDALRQLVDSGAVLRAGAGTRNDPYHYRIASGGSQVPVYTREPQSNNATLVKNTPESAPNSGSQECALGQEPGRSREPQTSEGALPCPDDWGPA